MRVCIPTEGDQGLSAAIAAHFGTAPHFTLVDLESGAIRTVANPSCHARPGACHHVELLRAHDVDAVVCGEIGRAAYKGLRLAGIRVLRPAGEAVADIVAALRAGDETPVPVLGTCRGHAGGGEHGECGGHRREHRHEHRHRHRHGHRAGERRP